jgi:hypothetical protein
VLGRINGIGKYLRSVMSRFHLNNLMDDCYYTELLMFIILAILAKPMQKLRQMIFGYLQNLKSFVSG